jgi:hypothetical protein
MGSSPNPSHHLKNQSHRPSSSGALAPPPASPFPHSCPPPPLPCYVAGALAHHRSCPTRIHGGRPSSARCGDALEAAPRARSPRALCHGGRPRGSREGRRVEREFCEPSAMGRLSPRHRLLPSLSPTWACTGGAASSTSLTRGRMVGGAQTWRPAKLPPSPTSARPVS